MNTRALTEGEKGVVRQFADRLEVSLRQQVLADLDRSMAEPAIPDSSVVRFVLADYARPPYEGQHSFGVEGRMLDKDDVEVSVVLYADQNDRLLELEFIRWGDGNLLGPRWDTLRVY
jgi:hypothetical protein